MCMRIDILETLINFRRLRWKGKFFIKILIWNDKKAIFPNGVQSNCQILKMCHYGELILILDRSSLIRLLDPESHNIQKDILIKDKVLDIFVIDS